MPVVGVNGVDIFWESFGDPADPLLLLISGLGAHATGFDDRLCWELAELGLHVVRFDNRDVGLSTHLPVDAQYTVADMANDAAGLIEELEAGPAHVLGASMGGMIAQQLAIDHPELVQSLTLVMTTTGQPDVGQASPELLAQLIELASPATDRADAIARGVKLARLIGSPEFDEDYHRRRQESFHDRAYDPPGVGRQMTAVVSSAHRAEGLAALDIPTVVIHGSVDPLIDPSGGRRTAELIPGAVFVEIEGMGHDLPPRIWPELIARVTSVTTPTSSESSPSGATTSERN
jgi:pimeloyl-ACP methyl ester carboxylesterase